MSLRVEERVNTEANENTVILIFRGLYATENILNDFILDF